MRNIKPLVFFSFVLLSSVSACSWEKPLYETYARDGEFHPCKGICILNEDAKIPDNQKACEDLKLTWRPATCTEKGKKLAEEFTHDPKLCVEHGGIMVEARCIVTDAAACTLLNSTWVDSFDILDLGNGRFIRYLSEDDSYICGNYNDIVTYDGTQTDNGCRPDDIQFFKQAKDNELCPMSSPHCVSAKYLVPKTVIDGVDTIDSENDDTSSEENTGTLPINICSTCTENLAKCSKPSGEAVCVDLLSDPNNCGSCNNKCSTNNDDTAIGVYCLEGVCHVINCDNPKELCDDKVCLDPRKNETCGISCDNRTVQPCIAGNDCEQSADGKQYKCTCKDGIQLNDAARTCVHPMAETTCNASNANPKGEDCTIGNKKCIKPEGENEYRCVCPSGIILNDEFKTCVDPSSNDTCGANEQNTKGMQCAAGLSCQPKPNQTDSDKKEYECRCTAMGALTCTNKDSGELYCVDTYSDAYCGATDCAHLEDGKCSPSQQCFSGQCYCRTDFTNCNGECVDSWNSTKYCGAKGGCSNESSESPNFKGVACKSTEECYHGQCKCKTNEGYIAYNGECIHPSQDEYCGFIKNGDDYVACSIDKSCQKDSKAEYGYSCQCKPGTYLLPDSTKCLDPMNDATHCGADSNGKNGKDCTKENKACVNGVCAVSCPDTQVFCNGKCIDKSEYHVNDDCTACDSNYCFDYSTDTNPFDYEQCKTIFDEKGVDTTATETIYHCGSSCDTNKVCGANTKCVNENGDFTCECTSNSQKRCGDDCLDFSLLHMTSCNTCAAGWDNCDGDWTNGCEVHLPDDKENCGICGNSCTKDAVNISAASCVNGQCNVDCNATSLNCDKNISNGCEIADKYHDRNHCGTCGKVCGNGRNCENGLCCINKAGEIKPDEKCCSGYKKYYLDERDCISSIGSNENLIYRCDTTLPTDKKWWVCHDWHEMKN